MTIQDLRVDHDQLVFTARYAGGCANHSFDLCWSETFLESYQVQARLLLLHDNGGDTCEAFSTQELRFDISAIKRAYSDIYRTSSGTVLLNLNQSVKGHYDF